MKVGNISMVDCTHTFLVSIRSCSQSDFNLKKKKNVTRVTMRTLTPISIKKKPLPYDNLPLEFVRPSLISFYIASRSFDSIAKQAKCMTFWTSSVYLGYLL